MLPSILKGAGAIGESKHESFLKCVPMTDGMNQTWKCLSPCFAKKSGDLINTKYLTSSLTLGEVNCILYEILVSLV